MRTRLTPKLIISFFLFTISIGIFSISPAKSYVIDIYNYISVIYWSSILLVMVSATIATTLFVRDKQIRLAWVTTSIIGFATGLVMLLPLFLQYPMYNRGDSMSHLGYVNYIQNFNEIPPDPYPVLHLVGATLAFTSGMETESIVLIYPIVSFAIFVTGCIAFVRIHTHNIINPATFLIIFLPIFGTGHWNFAPFAQSIFLFPFFLLVFRQIAEGRGFRSNMMIVLLMIVLPLIHPTTSVLFILVFFAMILRNQFLANPYPLDWELILILIVVLGYRIASTGLIYGHVTAALNWIIRGAGQSELAEINNNAAALPLDIFDYVVIFSARYGVVFILAITSFCSIIYLVFNRNQIAGPRRYTVFTLFLIEVVSFFASIFGLIFNITGFGFDRFVRFATLNALLVTTVGFSMISPLLKSRKFWKDAIVLSFTLLLVLTTVLTYFAAPVAEQPNQQVTRAELDGTEWFLEYSMYPAETHQAFVPLYRFIDAVRWTHSDVRTEIGSVQKAPRSLVYNRCREPRLYLLTSKLAYLYGPGLRPNHPETWIYGPPDFDMLKGTPPLSRIYNNGGFSAYYCS